MSLYYKLWSDAIQYEKNKHGHFRNWKEFVMYGITFCQALNLATLLFWLSIWIKTPFFIPINIFPGSMLDYALAGLITLYLPFIIINYLLIFYNKKYENILKIYPYRNGKLYIMYFIFSFGLFFIPILVGFIFNRLF